MNAIVVRQPWATLIALGVKTIETRPSPPNGPMRPEGVRGLPGCTLERGERIAIVASASAPPKGLKLGWEWAVGVSTVGPARHVDNCDEDEVCPDPEEGVWSDECRSMNEWVPAVLRDAGAHGWSVESTLPLGAVVCTVTVTDALPVVADPECDGIGAGRSLFIDNTLRLFTECWDHIGGGIEAQPLPDQLPLGDYTPGRWGWLLADPTPCHPVPVKGRQGVFVLSDSVEAAVRAQIPPASTPTTEKAS